MQLIIKIIITALLIAAISELGKRYSWVSAVLASLPLTSLIAMVWIYEETKDAQKVIDLSMSIFWMVIPSLVFFIVLPLLLKNGIKFYPALFGSSLITFATYTGYIFLMGKFWIKI